MKPEVAGSPLDATQSWWLLGAGAAALLPLAPHLPPWLVAAAAAALALRAGLIRARQPAPARWVLTLTVAPGMIGIVAQYRTLFGQNPGVALLVILFALKQLESGDRRDGYAIVLLGYFLMLTSFFYSQAIPTAAALLVAVVVTTAALASLADSRPPPQRLVKLAGLMLAQATPLLLILFILFPRVAGPLWGLPRDAYSAQTGLSDSMSPGSIGSLSQSDAIAFRVKFSGSVPARNQLYWRGPVLTLFDGTTWRPAKFSVAHWLPYAADAGSAAYEVTLEPDDRPWLFALELPTALPSDAVIASDYQLLATTPVIQRRRYEVRSQPGLVAGADEAPRVLRLATSLPRGNPRTLALGRSWRARHASDAAILKEALAFFVHQRLGYTLAPPPLGADSVDEFLFDTRQGFCEHFAGAFVFAMRAAGVPARVVTGYQGGEINPVDGYLTVRQSDAHAWTEVWLAGRGWTRVDPTAASFPQRIDLNLAAVVPAGDPLPLLMRADWTWLRDLRYRWDAVANRWNQSVLGYNPQRQRDLLARLGMRSPDWRNMTLTLTALCTAVLLGLVAWALHRRRRLDPAQALWLRATARLARRGLPRRPWEGPGDYAIRIAAARPETAAAILEIADLYGRVRYGSIDALELLRRRVAAFKP
ncbi:MAG: DUF3488 and transglutaminase-like domain-containing protein [Rhodocyclaceae bacterium]|nr:DUF3488 and transglutaminase-like domain-containing protein [Rhodocyclaceae bacterium]